VVRRSGIYGPREFMKIIENLITVWNIEVLGNLNELGRKAQEKIMAIPARLEKVAEYIESRASAKSFRFDVVYGRVLDLA
jgi:acyl-[acyl-carrier-protein] desaturase